jgi:hypothetical protein
MVRECEPTSSLRTCLPAVIPRSREPHSGYACGQAALGYYALPIRYGDRLVGELDPHPGRNTGVSRVAIHRDLAPWLDLELVLPER